MNSRVRLFVSFPSSLLKRVRHRRLGGSWVEADAPQALKSPSFRNHVQLITTKPASLAPNTIGPQGLCAYHVAANAEVFAKTSCSNRLHRAPRAPRARDPVARPATERAVRRRRHRVQVDPRDAPGGCRRAALHVPTRRGVDARAPRRQDLHRVPELRCQPQRHRQL